jgi:glycosyltransferase involved in cell wall biosynthesis
MKSIVSVITPIFNRADIIHETAQSIFNQSYPYWEWVIVDDGSTDNSWELLQQYAAKDKRVKTIQRKREPKGACTCRNIAIEHSTGEYLLFLDSDDMLASFSLEQRVQTIKQYPECDFVVFSMLMFRKTPGDLKLLWNIDNEQDDLERFLCGDPVCQTSGPFWKRDSIVKLGGWNEQLLLWQDIEFHLRSLLQGLRYVKRLDLAPDVFLRVSDLSLSRTGYHSLPKFLSRLQVLQQTAESIKHKNLLQQYRNGLRHMFADLFVNAVNSNYLEQVLQMKQMQQQWGLFCKSEQKIFSLYASLYKYKLYKIPFARKYLLQKLQRAAGVRQGTLNRISYHNTIKA